MFLIIKFNSFTLPFVLTEMFNLPQNILMFKIYKIYLIKID